MSKKKMRWSIANRFMDRLRMKEDGKEE